MEKIGPQDCFHPQVGHACRRSGLVHKCDSWDDFFLQDAGQRHGDRAGVARDAWVARIERALVCFSHIFSSPHQYNHVVHIHAP